MSKLWVVKFEVQSTSKLMGIFPLDMLRYDHCHPSSGEDVAKIPMSHHDLGDTQEKITLTHWSHGDKKWLPTKRRWESFGWRVVKVHPAYSIG